MKKTKNSFGLGAIEYLGHIIAEGKLMVDTSKTAAVAEWPIPNTIKELKLFLGLANYYHRFTKNFATTAVPLT